MRRMRKLWAVLLAVCMVCNLYGMDVFAAGNEQSVANGNKNGYTVYTEERAQEPEDAGVAGEAAGNGNSETVEDTGKAEDSDSADGATDSTESETEETDSGNTAEETEEDGSGNTAGDFEEGNSGNTGEETGDGDSADIPAGNETDNSGDIENGDSADENNGDAVEGDGERDDIDEPEEGSDGVDEENIEEEKSLLMKKTVMMTSGVGEVSRAEWLAELTETFSMSVMEDNYPDNYFSDIDSSSEYYYVVMLATEFGLVDVEAGEPFRPDDPATREFTAHTLNFCLGFLPEQEANYTFSEASDVTYADDIQVAVERGWFSLENGNFHPETPVTLDEKTIMVEDAKSVLADRKAPTEHSNSYTFAEDVIDLTKANVRAEMTDDNELTFYECSENLSAGNKYGLEFDGFPSVFKAVDITQAEDGLIVQFENVPLDEAFTNIDMQGGIDVDLATVQAYSDDVELHYIVGGTEEKEWEDGTKYDTLEEVGSREISAVEAVRTYSVSPEKSHEINLAPGVKITVSCKVSDVKPDYDIKLFEGKAHVAVNAKVIFGCNVSADAMEAAGISPTLELVRIPIACVGYFGVKMDMTMSGEATLNLVGNVFLGLYYEYGGFRMEKGFTKESFTLQTRMEISATVTATLGMNACNIMQGELYAKFGAKDVLDSITYGDGQKPATCAHQNAWLFASAGGYAQVKLGSVKPWKKDYPIYNEKNSPVRVSFHYEDGVAVSKCARGTIYGPTGKRWGYYTPVDSKYGYNGVSKGTGANGEPYTIFEYSLDDANRATITSYKGNVSALSIPKTLDGYTVVGIGNSVFQNNKQLRVVVVPDSVTEIGYQAFYNCTNLSQVTLSKNVKTMGTRAFGNCTSLTAIEIPKSLTDSGGPFEDCSNLRNVTFEKGVTEITNRLFWHCNGIEEVTIPDTVTVIEYAAFYNCSKLSRVGIPNSVTEIGSEAFENCAKLTEVNIPDSVTEIEYQAFYNCTNLSQVTLSKNVKTMGTRAFGNCTSLTAIEIPKSLTDSGGPFEDCSNLRNVTFEKGVTEITNRLFWHCNGIEEVTIPDTVTVIEYAAFYNCSKLSRVGIPNSVTEIGSEAFQNCAKLTEVNIPDSVTEIEYQAFYGCTNLPKISIPNSVTSLGTRAFAYCTNLRDVSLSEKLTSIGTEMFRDCGLTAITIPPLVTEINSYAFQNCSALTEVNMPNSMHNIGSYAFYNCDALTKVVIPDSVTTMGTYIFADCELLSDVTLGTGITTIPSYAFNLCPSLQKIVLPYRTAAINSNAFTNCTSLTEITIPRATTTIASGVFSYPARLTVYGVAGTYAETYANNIGATFINQETRATEVKLSATDLKLTKGSKATLYLSVAPSNFTDEVTWKSTDTNIATIEDTGIVTAKAIGTATVKVTVGDISASCKITVTQPVTSISLNKTSLCLEAWDTEKLTASVSPSTAENKAVLWSTSDARIASVDDTGLVTAHTKGTATITVTAQDGSGVSRSCTVTVVNNGYLCSTVAELESPHNYPVNCSDFWLYTKEGAESLYITFDLKTEVEEGFDYLCLYDGKGTQIGKYTGTELAGQAVEVPGDTVRIKLISDDSGTAWGFKVTYIMGTGDVENDECLVTFDSQGGTVVSAVQVAKGTAVPEPAAPTRRGYEFMGWYLGDTLYDFTQPVTGNTVLRAKWKFIVTEPDLSETEQIPEEDKPEDGVIPEGLWIAGVKDQTYTGKALKPEVRVYDGSRKLQEKTDYTISYKNNVRANDASDAKKAPTITVKGKGNYSGSVTAVFKIVPVNIAEQEFAVAIADMVLAHNGKIQKKAPVVTFNGKKLSNKRDYTVTYPDTGTGAYQEAGSYPVQITGVGNFTGTRTVNLEITDKMLISKAKAAKIPNQLYSGGEDVTLSADTLILYRKTINDPLKEGVDYTVTYENNREIGTATAVITGTGNYAGTKRITFKIMGTAINKAVVEGIENKIYNGMEQQQDITVRVEGKVLTPDKDYTVSYSKNLNVGTASMTIQGTGAYSGTTKKTFKIMAYDLGVDEGGFITEWKDGQQIGMPADSADKAVKSGEGTGTSLTVEYTQGGSQPEVTLKFRETELIKGKDYTISYKNNKNLADQSVDKAPTMTIKGKGNFKGTRSEKFSIVKKNLANPESPVLMSVPDVAYANGAGKYISKPVLTDTNGKTLKAGTDYEVSYTSSDGFTKLDKKSTVQAGAFVCVTVRGKGKYEGSLMTTYRITQANFTKASVRIAPQIYTGSNIYLTGGTNGDILVKAGKMELTYGVDYEIMEDSYVNNIKKGTASVKIRGINNYGGTRTVKFKIQAKKIESFSSIVRAVLFGTE